MDPEHQRIEEDLRGLLQGEVRCDDLFTQLYASDASIYEIRPLGVVRPRSVDDVVATVQYAAENNIPIHAARRRHGPGRRVARPRARRRLLALLPPHLDGRRRAGARAARRRAGHAQSLPGRAGADVRPRPGDEPRHHDGQRRGDRRRRQPLAASTARPAGTSKRCRSCWPTATVLEVGRHPVPKLDDNSRRKLPGDAARSSRAIGGRSDRRDTRN